MINSKLVEPRSPPHRKLVLRLVALVPGVAIAAIACTRAPDSVETVRAVSSAALAPSLGTTQAFAVLAGSTVTNTGPTVVTGDLGVSPGLAVTGFPPGLVNGGTIQAGTAAALQAQSDTTAAYNDLAGQACDVDLTGKDLGGLTLTAGSYCFSSSAQLTGAVTLDAQGDPGAVFIFQIGSTLTTASDSSVLMTNGGNLCQVFWQVGSSATLGTGTKFVGSILALTSITATTGASISGRALARNGAVTLDTNTVSAGSCAEVDAGAGGAGGSGDVATGGAATGGVAAGGAGTGGRSSGGSASGSVGIGGTEIGGTAAGGTAAGGAGDSSGGSAGADTAGSGGAAPTTCGGICVDLQTDAMNCGSCDHVCDLLSACIKGMCCAPLP